MVRFEWTGFFALAALVTSGSAHAGDRQIRALEDLRARYGLTAFDSIPGFGDRLRRVKIGVIDNGFGDSKTLEDFLPAAIAKQVLEYPKAFLEKHPRLGPVDEAVPIDNKDMHGREMAEIVWGMTGMDRSRAPQIYLLNGKSLFNLERAVQYAIDEKIQILLYSQNYEYGGNFDGRGFINAIVSRATAAGILWVNAAGNYGGRTFNGGVKFDEGKKASGDDTWLDLGGKKELRILSRLDNNPVKIILSWNRNSESYDTGTDRDLDLLLYDEFGAEVATSESVQKFGGRDLKADETKNETFLPREIINTSLSRNKSDHYTLRVKAKAGRFDGTDKIRVALVPVKAPYFDAQEGKLVEAVEFPDATEGQEIMVPGDHPDVITVGDLTVLSAKGPTMDADRRAKPDLHLETSQVEFTDGESSAGTSNAAAMFAGIVTMLRAQNPKISRTDLLAFVKKMKPSAVFKPGAGRGIQDLGVARVGKLHPILFDTIKRQCTIHLAGRYRSSGIYVMAIDEPLVALSRTFPSLSDDPKTADRYDVFLYVKHLGRGRSEIWAYPRDRSRGPKAKKEAWEANLESEPELFVQVVQARRREKAKDEKEVPIWQTPPPTKVVPSR